MEEGKNKKYKLLIIGALIISLIGLAYPIFEIIYNKAVSAEGIIKILCYLFVIYYLFIGYKKPHGNLLRIIFMLFAFTVLIQAIATANVSDNAAYLVGTASIFIAYISGKLHKYKNNQVIATVALSLLLLGYAISLAQETSTDFILKVTNLDLVVEWLALLAVYYVRFNLHVEAGKKEANSNVQE